MESQETLPATPAAPGDRAIWWQWALASLAGGTLAWALFGLPGQLWALLGLPGRLTEGDILWLVFGAAAFSGNEWLLNVLLVAWAALALVGGGVFGAILGAAQWLVLRRHVAAAAWWVPACAAGWLLDALATQLVLAAMHYLSGRGDSTGPDLQLLGQLSQAGWVLGLVGIALAQWGFLRRRVRRAAWWIPACILGLAASGTVGTALLFAAPAHTEQPVLPITPDVGPVVSPAAAGLATVAAWGVYGVVTGPALAWLLHQYRQPISPIGGGP